MKADMERMPAHFGAALLLAVVSPIAFFYLPGVVPADYCWESHECKGAMRLGLVWFCELVWFFEC